MIIQTWDLAHWKDFASTISSFATFVAVLIGGGWFLYTWQPGRRSYFDLECSFYLLDGEPDTVIAEIRFVLENRGLVAQDIYGFSVSVHGLQAATQLRIDSNTKALHFERELLGRVVVPMVDANVRPGIRRVFTHVVKLAQPGHLVRISASLHWSAERPPINTVTRVFEIL